MMKRILLLILLVSFMALPAMAQYSVGDTVANFTLPDGNNQPVSLYDYPNRIMFLVFWSTG
ncbi:MAG: hypothetical protein C4524_08915 [Candidatus Zixiibacteriota bacterium]|nr:MAG: hypothetical protein C4524_08915 [candidate division Zixibacteria bacterium]